METCNDKFRKRTKILATGVIKVYEKLTNEIKIVGKQLVRSASSVAANFHAATRARRDAEYFARLSLVIEEADETLIWPEIMLEAELAEGDTMKKLMAKTTELLSVFAKTRKTIKNKNK